MRNIDGVPVHELHELARMDDAPPAIVVAAEAVRQGNISQEDAALLALYALAEAFKMNKMLCEQLMKTGSVQYMLCPDCPMTESVLGSLKEAREAKEDDSRRGDRNPNGS